VPAAARPVGQSDNLIARIAEAERESWPGEVEGFQVNLAGAEEKLDGSTTRAKRSCQTRARLGGKNRWGGPGIKRRADIVQVFPRACPVGRQRHLVWLLG
jgi:hypothetical protein